MASLFSPDARVGVLPMLGDTGKGNIELLLDSPRIDMAFVSTDALAEAKAGDGTLAARLQFVTRLFPQEVHILARSEIGGFADLAGKKVNLGPAGSNSAVTGATLFKALGIDVEALDLDIAAGIERVKQGSISAAVIVSGKPAPLIGGISKRHRLRLLPVPFGPPLEAAYLPTRFAHADYPNLVPAGAEISTVATGTVLLTAKANDDPGAGERIAQVVDTVFARFAELQEPGRHPKWREVNLAANLTGFERSPAAAAWLARHPPNEQPVAANASMAAGPAMPDPFAMSNEQKEVLFKQFIEWQRARED